MKVENVGVVPPLVSGITRMLAKGYPNPSEMQHQGDKIGKQGMLVAFGGAGLMLLGGSIDALSGTERPQVYGGGRMLWAAGLLLAVGGGARATQGTLVEQGGKTITTALRQNRAELTP